MTDPADLIGTYQVLLDRATRDRDLFLDTILEAALAGPKAHDVLFKFMTDRVALLDAEDRAKVKK